MNQTQWRVFKGETVPADENAFSLFDPHTGIIKGAKDVAFGYKLNFTTGRIGLVFGVVIESGNPADTARFLPMMERQTTIYGCPSRQVAGHQKHCFS
jgi:IS5 family transposase